MPITIQTTAYNLIYAYSRTAHPGMLKVGVTTVDAYDVSEVMTPNCEKLYQATVERLKSDATTQAVDDIKIEYAELAFFEDANGIRHAFIDRDVHDVLLKSGFEKAVFQNTFGTPQEWFLVTLNDVKKAIAAVKSGLEFIDGPPKKKSERPEIKFRDEQKDAIETTTYHYAHGSRRMLWNAKMRFGKTLCTLELIRRQGYERVLILTHRPAVQASWFEDYHLIPFGEKHQYGSKNGNPYAKCDKNDQKGKDFRTLKSAWKQQKKKYIYFASMQDLRGSKLVSDKGIDKNNDVFKTEWDLIVFDEAHEGMETQLGKNVIKGLCENRNPYCLYLSGTPFNILKNFEEDEIFTWDYLMEQEAKEKWFKDRPDEDNPYKGLAKLNIYAYDLGEVFDINNYVRTEDDFFNFAEFFAIDKEKNCFTHEQHVKRFLDMLCDDSIESKYPYSNEEFRKGLNHTLWMLPGVDAAEMLCAMINKHKLHTEFGFHVVNVAGEGKQMEDADEDDINKIGNATQNALDKVKDAIKQYGKTITLSCGRLTTGVSVPEWTGVFMLRGGVNVDAGNYMQTIFRGQTPYKNGAIKKNCYAFDFAPDRTIVVLHDYIKKEHKCSQKQRERNGEPGDENGEVAYTESMLRFCPVIAMKGGKEVSYEALNFIQDVNRIISDDIHRNGAKSHRLHKSFDTFTDNDFALLEKVGKLFHGGTVKTENGKIVLSEGGLTGEDGSNGKPSKSGGKGREKTGEKPLKPKKPDTPNKDKRTKAQNVFDQILVRLSLLLFGALDKEKQSHLTIEKILGNELIDDESWFEFMPKQVTKTIIGQISHLLDESGIFDYTNTIVQAVIDADAKPVEQRVIAMTVELGRLHYPDHETVLTPWRVVNMHLGDTIGGYNFFNEKYSAPVEPRWVEHEGVTKEIFCTDEPRLLEINSKSGVYPLYLAYTLWRVKRDRLPKSERTPEREKQIWWNVLKNNIFVLCKTPMAKKITERVLKGYSDHETHCAYQDGLVDILRLDHDDKKKQKLLDKLNSTKFWDINTKGDDNMKFNAIVGNPPYQEMDGGNGVSAKPMYQLFVESAKKISPAYITMIMPARWYAGGKGLDDFRNNMVKDKSIVKIIDFESSKDCFPNVGIAGGLCYFLWQSNYSGLCEFINQKTTGIHSLKRSLDEFDVVIRSNSGISILRKVLQKNNDFVFAHAYPRNPFNFQTNFKGRTTYEDGDVAILTSKGFQYVKRTEVTKNQNLIDKYKILIGRLVPSNGELDIKEGEKYKVITDTRLIEPGQINTETYLDIGVFDTLNEAKNFESYLHLKSTRFLLRLAISSLNVTRECFRFVPMQDFSKPWTDAELYAKYGLDDKEIAFIESMIRPME